MLGTPSGNIGVSSGNIGVSSGNIGVSSANIGVFSTMAGSAATMTGAAKTEISATFCLFSSTKRMTSALAAAMRPESTTGPILRATAAGRDESPMLASWDWTFSSDSKAVASRFLISPAKRVETATDSRSRSISALSTALSSGRFWRIASCSRVFESSFSRAKLRSFWAFSPSLARLFKFLTVS